MWEVGTSVGIPAGVGVAVGVGRADTGVVPVTEGSGGAIGGCRRCDRLRRSSD